MSVTRLIRPDSRGRISLAKFDVEPGAVYLVEVSAHGTISLIPAQVIPKTGEQAA